MNAHDQASERLDQALMSRRLLRSRTLAQTAIKAGSVLVNGAVCTRAAASVSRHDAISIRDDSLQRYVSRGGFKLEAALDSFQIDPHGLQCLDIGASTGGFTDCLLQRGAAHVDAVDVGEGQLAATIAENNRVTVHEHVNARDLASAGIAGPYDLIVIDVSFISLRLILPSAVQTLSAGGAIIALIKPQFEVGRERLGKGGIVREERDRREAVEQVHAAARQLGLEMPGDMLSPIAGGDGNAEYLARYKRQGG